MKTKITLIIGAILMLAVMSCSQDFKKTKSGLVYKIIPGGSKDSVAKAGNVLKFHFVRKVNDSVFYTSYGKMPGFTQLMDDPGISYSPLEVMFMMKKGDSAVIVEVFDSLIKKGMQQQLPFAKKGDQIKTYLKILEVFRADSLAQKDYEAEMVKDRPRQEQEMKEAQAKQIEEMKKQKEKEIEDMKKSGDLDKQIKEVVDYLAAKKIVAQKAPGGTFYTIKQKGDGPPALPGKFVTVKYSGRGLKTDSVFQSSVYTFPLGQGEVIEGWDDAIPQFNQGGSGTLYIPGYLAYGKRQGPAGVDAALIFDVEVLNVSDTREQADAASRKADSLAAAKKTGN